MQLPSGATRSRRRRLHGAGTVKYPHQRSPRILSDNARQELIHQMCERLVLRLRVPRPGGCDFTTR